MTKKKETKKRVEKKVSPKKIKQNLFLKLFPENKYNIGKTLDAVGVFRDRYHEWIKDEGFAKQIEDLYQKRIDDYENHLLNQSEAGQTTATIFFLKTKGKERGYSEDNTSLLGNDNEITINVIRKIE